MRSRWYAESFVSNATSLTVVVVETVVESYVSNAIALAVWVSGPFCFADP
jgi:hypothetical protein